MGVPVTARGGRVGETRVVGCEGETRVAGCEGETTASTAWLGHLQRVLGERGVLRLLELVEGMVENEAECARTRVVLREHQHRTQEDARSDPARRHQQAAGGEALYWSAVPDEAPRGRARLVNGYREPDTEKPEQAVREHHREHHPDQDVVLPLPDESPGKPNASDPLQVARDESVRAIKAARCSRRRPRAGV